MFKRIMMSAVAGVLLVGLTVPSAFAFSCPKLIGAGRRLAANAMGETKQEALRLLDEALAAHKEAVKTKTRKGHIGAMQKATRAIDLLTK